MPSCNPVDAADDRLRYEGEPKPLIVDGKVDIIVRSCCYDYGVETLTAEQAIAFGSLVVELGRELLRRRA